MNDHNADDVDRIPKHNSDSLEEIQKFIDPNVYNRYEVHSYRHAAAILKTSYPSELDDIENALLQFSITKQDIAMPGGNESIIPKKFSKILRPKGWYETRIQGDLIVRIEKRGEDIVSQEGLSKIPPPQDDEIILENYIDGHKIDYVKGKVAFDLEWNSKDQTFDRDLYAFRLFHECGVIGVAIIITRSENLNYVFERLPLLKKNGTIDYKEDGTPKMCKQKYGASTTWMGKLLYRLNAGRHGGCPVLVFGIKPEVITDWNG